MRLTITKSKNSEHLYITKGFRDKNGKSTSFTVKKLGTMSDLLPLFGNNRNNVISWAKMQAQELTLKEQEGSLDVNVTLSENIRNLKDDHKLYEMGYLFPQAICSKLKFKDITENITSKTDVNYDLADILTKLVCSRLLYPASKLSTMEYSKKLIESPKFELHQIYRALSLLANNSDFIQAELYKNSLALVSRNKSVLYYDCTNFFFEIEEEKGIRKFGKCKEHKPNPIVQMGLFMDADGLPLAITVFDGNKNEQPSLKPLEKQILMDFKLSKLIVCTDSGLASTSNRKFNSVQDRGFVVTQTLKKVSKHIKNWALNLNGWRLYSSNTVYDLSQIDESVYYDKIFYKDQWINENGIEQRIIVTYSVKYKNYQQKIRNQQINRAKDIVDGTSSETRNLNSPLRFVKKTMITKNGEVAEKTSKELDTDKISEEKMYDGFYAVCTNLEDPVETIIAINKGRWQIEDTFRTMKTECKARPVYLQRDERIKAHFLTCFIALLVLRILEKKLKIKTTKEELIHTLRDMKIYKLRDLGYLSAYTRTDITDALNEAIGIKTDNEFISTKTIKKILKETKKI